MAFALGTTAVVLVVLVWELLRGTLKRLLARAHLIWVARRRAHGTEGYDPGRERRAEQRARALLRSCVDEYDWEMYRDLGFLRVWGALASTGAAAGRHDPGDAASGNAGSAAPYAYLIYPHKPLVAYLPDTGELLSEYCVTFPDHTRPYGSVRLPHSDDVLAKWMALSADERRLIGEANMHLPGRQVDPDRIRRDLVRLARWESERAGSVRAA